MPEKVHQISADQWREWIVDAICRILQQKQCATLPRICAALRKRHTFHEDTVAVQLNEAVESGVIRALERHDKTIYRVVKKSGVQKWPVQNTSKSYPTTNVLCIECLKTALKGPNGHKPEPMSSCVRCGISLHDSCANKLAGVETKVSLSQLVSAGNRWFCEECKGCDGCNTANESITSVSQCVVECASCGRKFHLQCMNPPGQSGERKQLKESWRCADCIQAAGFDETLEQRIKQYDQTIPSQKLDNDRTKTEEQIVRPHPTEAELIAGRVEAMRLKLGDRVTADDLGVFREVLRMRCKLEQEDLKRTPEAIRLGRHEIETWYSSPFPQEYAKLKVLYMCEFCLKYMKTNGELDHHQRKCSLRHPPGWEIYRDGERSVFEVDGNDQKLYCQSLCLLAKLFLDHKTLYFDVEPFLFYILTVRDHLGHHVVGYFSKEKYNQLRYNVSCILTMPQYQRQGYGRFLIEFSYLLSRVEGKPGTPERPLSDLGRVSYQQYWCSALLAYFYLNRNDTLTLEKVSRETGMIVGDIVEALRKLGFIRYRVERAGCIRTNRPFICVDWQRVEQHQQRVVSARKRIELREMCLLWIPNMRLSIAMKQFMHGLSRKPIEDISPVTSESDSCKQPEQQETRIVQGFSTNGQSLPQLDIKAEQLCEDHNVTITSTGRTRFRSRKYSDTIYDLSLSLTTGTPKTYRRSNPLPNTVPVVKSRSLRHSSLPGIKLPFIVLVPLKMEPSERPMLPSSPTPPYDIEDISLDSVEAFMGTPKSELQKSSPEKHLGGPGFTPIAPFRRQDDGDSGTATGDEACGRFGTPKTTRRHHPVMGNGTRRRKRVVLPSEEINPKRLRLDIMARGSEVDEMCLKEAVHHSILQLDKESVKCFVPGRSTGGGRASLDEYSVKPNKLLALFGRPLPRTV